MNTIKSMISANQLSRADQKTVWEYVQKTQPDLAKMVTHPDVQQIIKTLGAKPMFPQNVVKSALAAANRNRTNPAS